MLLLTVLHATTFRIEDGQHDRLTGTRKANVELAYSLQDNGVFSESRAESAGRAVSAYRPPAYPAFLALGMLAAVDFDGHDSRSIVRQASRFLSPLYTLQKLLLLLTAYLAMYAVWRSTRNRWLSLLPFPFICHTPLLLLDHRSILNTYTNLFYPTPLAAFVITALGVVLLVTFEKRRFWQFALSGLLAGVMALTRAAFLYYIILGALILVIWLWRRQAQRRFLTPRVVCCIAVALVVVTGWMARNQHQFGRWFIAERGGYQLNIRVQMLDMNRSTYLASFLFWSNSPWLADSLLPRWIGAEQLREVESKLDPDSRASFKKAAKAKWLHYQRRYMDSVTADRVLLRESVAAIAKRPIRHLLISIPLIHRGICVERYYWLNWLFFFALCGVTAQALRRGSSPQLAMLSPVLFCFLFNVATTNNLPRYNTLLLPLLSVAVALAVNRVVQSVVAGRRRRRRATAASARED